MRIVALLAIAARLSFGQISPPPTNAPSGAAGGNLSGTYPNPTVAKINGTTVAVNSAANQVALTTAAAVTAWTGIPSCQDTVGQHLNFNTTTHAFSCGTSLPTTAVTPGSYTNTSLTVDAQGRLTAASSGAGGTPASPANSVQFNNAGAFGGSANLTYDPATGLISKTHTAVGNSAAIDYLHFIYPSFYTGYIVAGLEQTVTETGLSNIAGFGSYMTVSPSSVGTGIVAPIDVQIQTDGANATDMSLWSITGQGGTVNHNAASQLGTDGAEQITGTFGAVYNDGTGTISGPRGVWAEIQNFGAAALLGNSHNFHSGFATGPYTNWAGLAIEPPSSATFSGTFDGILIDDQSAATGGTPYNLRSLGTTSNNKFEGSVNVGSLGTSTNCSSAASPAVCASAAAGSVAIPTGTNPTLVVNTNKVTANSQIFLQSDDTLGTKLSTTCNSTLASLAAGIVVTARTAGTSFTITFNGVLATNPLCLSYAIIN